MPTANVHEVLTTESTLTRRGQTTIPNAIRKALALRPSDKIRFSLHTDNTVTVERAEADEVDDPMIERFLAFLERDSLDHPAHLRAVETGVASKARDLVSGVEVDLDAPLSDADE